MEDELSLKKRSCENSAHLLLYRKDYGPTEKVQRVLLPARMINRMMELSSREICRTDQPCGQRLIRLSARQGLFSSLSQWLLLRWRFSRYPSKFFPTFLEELIGQLPLSKSAATVRAT